MAYETEELKGPALFGLIGHPVSHSVGQFVFRRIFDSLGLDCLYLSIDVHPDVLEETVSGMKKKFLGFNVTIPHKIAVMKKIDDLDPSASDAMNVNLAVAMKGKLCGYNTDYIALKHLFSSKFPDLKVKNPLIFGTGGTCRTSVAVLRNLFHASSITIVSRDPEKAAQRLAETGMDGLEIVPYERVGKLREIDAIFNCTPYGMESVKGESLPLPHSLREMPAVVDFVYSPVNTDLISWARDHGTNVISGDEIYIRQAIETVSIVFGSKIREEQMKQYFNESAGAIPK